MYRKYGKKATLTNTKNHGLCGIPYCPGKTASTYHMIRMYNTESTTNISRICPKVILSSTDTGTLRLFHCTPEPVRN